MGRTDEMWTLTEPNFCDNSDHNDGSGYTHNLSVDTHHDFCLLCAVVRTTGVYYNKI